MSSQPLARYRAGPVHAALWANRMKRNGHETIMHKVSVERRYRDADGRWRSTGSFTRNELPMLIHCLQQAYAGIIERENHRTAHDEPARERSSDGQASEEDANFPRPA